MNPLQSTHKIQYHFRSKPWKYQGPGGWHFISLPQKLSNEIRNIFKSAEGGWGRLPATSRIGGSEWKTAIWYDSKMNTYLLPVKAEIRNKEHVVDGELVTMSVLI